MDPVLREATVPTLWAADLRQDQAAQRLVQAAQTALSQIRGWVRLAQAVKRLIQAGAGLPEVGFGYLEAGPGYPEAESGHFKDGLISGRKNRGTEGQKDRQMDGLMDGWMEFPPCVIQDILPHRVRCPSLGTTAYSRGRVPLTS